MTRLIDADALRKQFDADKNGYCGNWEFCDKPSDVQFIIDNAPTIDAIPNETVQGWIPCSERLPMMREVTRYGETYRMSECVLVTGTLEYQDFDTYNTSIFVGNCFDDMNGTDIYWYQNEDRIVNVVAWMPLPTPYKGGDDE